MLPDLTPAEQARYARHLSLPQVGAEGQRRLKQASVLCIGAGGLGSPVALYLAAAGVGALGIVDPDLVDLSNLQRQILHGQSDIGRPKTESAARRLREINPHVELHLVPEPFTAANARTLAAPFDLIVDGTDNFPTRYLSNDVAFFLGKPNIYGSIFQFEGQVSVFSPRTGGPCYRCMFPQPPAPGLVPSCAEGGVFGVLPGLVGCLQATEAIKWILGCGEPLAGRLLHIDTLSMRFREFRLRRDPQCPLCGENPSLLDLVDYEAFCGVPLPEQPVPSWSPTQLQAALQAGDTLLLDVREFSERQAGRIDPSLHIPLGELASRVGELPRDRRLVVHCRSGVRSEQAARWLRKSGFSEVSHLAGGILAWAAEIDPSLATS